MNQTPTTGIYVALGSNLGFDNRSPAEILNSAISRLAEIYVISTNISSLWQSPAWPDPAAPAYVNAVVRAETSLGPRELLAVLQQVEIEFGRVRGNRYASRTLDLDIVDFEGLVLDEAGLTLPHPRAHQRAFVLMPLREIAPDWVEPRLAKSIVELLDGLERDAAMACTPLADIPLASKPLTGASW